MKPLFDQSDRSLYSMLTDALVGLFLRNKLFNDKDVDTVLIPRTFASEPHGGVLTQSWLVLIKTIKEAGNTKTLRSNAEVLEKSEELIEAIAGRTLLWAISNHKHARMRKNYA